MLHVCQPGSWQVPRILETPIRTLTRTPAWRLLALFAGLLFALLSPGVTMGVLAADNTASISGIVVVESSSGPKPVANAEVRLTFGSKFESRKTGADGKYAFTSLLPGRYTIKVSPPDGLKAKGDGTISVALDAGDSERADFGLLSLSTPTPTPTAAPKTTPSATPAATSAARPTHETDASAAAAAAAAAVQIVAAPPLVQPFASPATTTQASTTQPGTQARVVASTTPSPVAAVATGSAPGANALIPAPAASPAPFLFGTPGMIVAAGSPTPAASGTPATDPGEDVLASGPPRRLITSFEALRETAGGGSTAQLKSWATESSLVLGVPFRTQIDGTSFSLVNCGPASLTMVLTAFGLDVDPPSVRDYLNHLVGNYDTEAGTSLYVLARIAREAGLNTFGTSAGLQGWTVEAIREHVRAGHPVITLTKYRFLPGHFGSVTDFDHYIVITGLAGEDFVYNDAAYSTEYGYNLLISPSQLERAWAASSVPRHAVAIGFGDSLKPLPIVPRGLTAESLAAAPAADVNAAPPPPARINRGAATEWLREQMLDRLGARTAIVSGLPASAEAVPVPRTRLDPADLPTLGPAVEERPSGSAVVEPSTWDHVPAGQTAEAVAQGRRTSPDAHVVAAPTDRSNASTDGADTSAGSVALWLSPLGLGMMGFGVVLALVGRLTGANLTPIRVRLPRRLPRLPRLSLRRRR